MTSSQPLCAICDRPIGGEALNAAGAAEAVHPACFAERLPYDAAATVIATAALFLVPFLRVWSA